MSYADLRAMPTAAAFVQVIGGVEVPEGGIVDRW